MKILNTFLVSKEILWTMFNYLLLFRSLLSATCVLVSMVVVVVVGLPEDVMVGTVVDVVGVVVEVELD